ncbi:trypsin-like peptidase domain-containing protein [Candidatus Kaiserbacteria bacterium]|nr:MAG: trypsin-like peptidase domain-containing protein [Candidatus Kaiserbacteria bacterium]
MVVLTFLQNIVVSVLVGYLSITNTLAGHIESFFESPQREEVLAEAETTLTKDVLTEIAPTGDSFRGAIPKILLEHAEYQRAAVLASKQDENMPTSIGDVPLEEAIENALVNIYCQYKTDEYIRTTTGTGFFINQKGVILTNAHVAQFLLLKEIKGVTDDIECVIRSGNPASPKYVAELLYISPTWVFKNSEVVVDESPRGTGERDYALLYIAKSTNGTPLPIRFPTLPIDTTLLSRETEGLEVFTAGYPAEELMRRGADAELYPVLAPTQINALYTFGSNYADLFSISASPVGEHGASGGPIVNVWSQRAIGLIVTKGDIAEGEKSLRALTLSYVDRTIIEETGFSLSQNMQGDIAYRGLIFNKAMAPFLSDILMDELQGE